MLLINAAHNILSIPYEGIVMNYIQSLEALAEGDFSIEYTHGSRGSKLAHPSSSFTAVVQDIANGLVDIGAGPFWVT